MNKVEIMKKAFIELQSAKIKHKHFPEDIIHQVSIMNEEAGESIRATLNYVYHNEDKKEIELELIQTMAMCIRILENF